MTNFNELSKYFIRLEDEGVVKLWHEWGPDAVKNAYTVIRTVVNGEDVDEDEYNLAIEYSKGRGGLRERIIAKQENRAVGNDVVVLTADSSPAYGEGKDIMQEPLFRMEANPDIYAVNEYIDNKGLTQLIHNQEDRVLVGCSKAYREAMLAAAKERYDRFGKTIATYGKLDKTTNQWSLDLRRDVTHFDQNLFSFNRFFESVQVGRRIVDPSAGEMEGAFGDMYVKEPKESYIDRVKMLGEKISRCSRSIIDLGPLHALSLIVTRDDDSGIPFSVFKPAVVEAYKGINPIQFKFERLGEIAGILNRIAPEEFPINAFISHAAESMINNIDTACIRPEFLGICDQVVRNLPGREGITIENMLMNVLDDDRFQEVRPTLEAILNVIQTYDTKLAECLDNEQLNLAVGLMGIESEGVQAASKEERSYALGFVTATPDKVGQTADDSRERVLDFISEFEMDQAEGDDPAGDAQRQKIRAEYENAEFVWAKFKSEVFGGSFKTVNWKEKGEKARAKLVRISQTILLNNAQVILGGEYNFDDYTQNDWDQIISRLRKALHPDPKRRGKLAEGASNLDENRKHDLLIQVGDMADLLEPERRIARERRREQKNAEKAAKRK